VRARVRVRAVRAQHQWRLLEVSVRARVRVRGCAWAG